jgi:hypothetical protein
MCYLLRYLLGVLVLGGMANLIVGVGVKHGRNPSIIAFAVCLASVVVVSAVLVVVINTRLPSPPLL